MPGKNQPKPRQRSEAGRGRPPGRRKAGGRNYVVGKADQAERSLMRKLKQSLRVPSEPSSETALVRRTDPGSRSNSSPPLGILLDPYESPPVYLPSKGAVPELREIPRGPNYAREVFRTIAEKNMESIAEAAIIQGVIRGDSTILGKVIDHSLGKPIDKPEDKVWDGIKVTVTGCNPFPEPPRLVEGVVVPKDQEPSESRTHSEAEERAEADAAAESMYPFTEPTVGGGAILYWREDVPA